MPSKKINEEGLNTQNIILSEVEKELCDETVFTESIKVSVSKTTNNNSKSEDLEEMFKPYREQFRHLRQELQQIKSFASKSLLELNNLEKDVYKAYRTMAKKSASKPKRSSRIPTGFAKPTVISDELCDFLGKPHGCELARTEVTKYMSEYIKKHSLQHHRDKRKIVPDRKLTKLLRLQKSDKLTYFNLQRFMKHHFTHESTSSLEAST